MAKTQNQSKRRVFERKPEELQAFLDYLDELTRKDRGSGLYEAYDVNPRAFRVGEVRDPSGLGQDIQRDPVRFSQYAPGVIPFEAPNVGGVEPYQFDPALYEQWQMEQPQQPGSNFMTDNEAFQDRPQAEPGSAQEFKQLVDQMTAYPVTRSDDGGLIMSDGSIRYNDGTTRMATQADVPRPVRELSNGMVLLTNGDIIDPNTTIGEVYQGASGLSNLLFGREQHVTQQYGNYNPNLYKSGRHSGIDYRTRDLDQDFAFVLPFNARVRQVITEESGSPYGNSVLLELPDGKMIRMSHLGQIGNLQEGQTIGAFEFIGTPGNTGVSTGEHLDVEYYNPDGSRLDPNQFMLDASNMVDYRKISESINVDEGSLSPEDRAWAKAQKDLHSQGVEASPSPQMVQEYMQQEVGQQQPQQASQEQPRQPFRERLASGVEQWNPTGQYGVGATELMRGDTEGAKQELSQTVEGMSPIRAELGIGEMIRGEDPVQARISALSQQPKVPAEDRGLWGKTRQLLGNVTERFGDMLGFPEGSISETIAGGATKRTNQALANQIGGQAPEQVPGIRQNIADIGQDLKSKGRSSVEQIAQSGRDVLRQAGEGVRDLKEGAKGIASGLFEKMPLMSLFEGQKQVGDVSGEQSVSEGMAKTGPKDIRDAFFKFGGTSDFAKYLVDNAQEKKGGALDTSLFKSDFYQDPNAIANVFGQTSQGKEATDKFRDYLGSNVKEGFDEPYRTEQRVEGDYIVEYKIPIKEYFENKYWQDQIKSTPDVLKGDFSYDKFQMPTEQRRSMDRFSGEAGISDSPTIFKSGAVDLFRGAGDKMAKKAGEISKPLADVYKSSVKSAKVDIPKALTQAFKMPSSTSAKASAPKTTSRVVGTVPKESSSSSGSSGGGQVYTASSPDTSQLSQRTSSPASNISSSQQYYNKIMQPLKPQPITTQQQARADIRNPAIYKSTQDWVRLLMQGAGR
jgi:murein DD-endopeptidase MepM/ murein hydrolase activator NlpD